MLAHAIEVSFTQLSNALNLYTGSVHYNASKG